MLGNEEKQMVIGLFPFFNEKPTIIDVGSNKGHFADVILEEYGENCDIHLFEPVDLLLNYTRVKYEYKQNIRYNNLIAWSVDNEKMKFNYFENFNNELSSVYDGEEDWDGLPKKVKEVIGIRVDTYCNNNDIKYVDFIKIDCEGADYDVLIGCEDLLKNERVRFVQVEYGSLYKRGGKQFKNLIQFVNKYGYKCYSYDGNYCEVKEESFIEDYRFENFIITKEEIHNYSVGWNKDFIINTSELRKMNLVLEVGAFEGLTTKYICENMLDDIGRVVVIDPLEDNYVSGDVEHPYFKGQYQRFLRNTRGLPVELYRGLSEDEFPKLYQLRFDLVYIDANHYYPNPYIDGSWAFAVTRPQGYIIFDDYTWREETKKSIEMFLADFSGYYDLISKDYQVVIRKVTDKYNKITEPYYL